MKLSMGCTLAVLLMLTIVQTATVIFADPALDLPLARSQAIDVAGQQLQIDGQFIQTADGGTALGIGEALGPTIPASPFCAETGTIAFTVCYQEPAPENRLINRHIVTLRMESTGFLGFYFIQESRRLEMSYKRLPETHRLVTPEPLEVGRSYRVAATWDGALVCFYLDGRLVGQMKQGFPASFPHYARLNIGPYRDGWVTARPWGANDVLVRDLRIWKRPLDALEMAADANVEVTKAIDRFPTHLAVPQNVAPVMDGKLDDEVWQQASSFVALVDQVEPAKSLAYPDNRPLFFHDGESLYVGFETIFPTGTELLSGQPRGDADTEVWADESFEFYIEVDGRLYRFGGNPAGGCTESLDGDIAFEGAWEYATNLEYRIDDRYHWQGEIRIPFATIGLAEPIGVQLPVNFCRTWRCLDEIGITSLQHPNGQNYGDRSRFASIRLVSSSDGAVISASTDLSFGNLSQNVVVHSDHGGEFRYTIAAVNALGDGDAVFDEHISVNAGGQMELRVDAAIGVAAAEQLLFRLEGPGEELLIQQLVPFQLSDDYLEVTPVFGAGKLLLAPRHAMLLRKHPGISPALRVLSPGGDVLYQAAMASDDRISVPFGPDNPTGIYSAEVVSGEGDALIVHTSKRFAYTGRGSWEEFAAPNMVIPPFEPLQSEQAGERLQVQMWGRRYQFDGSPLPTSIQSQGQELLAGPVQLSIGGKPLPDIPIAVSSSSPVRLEYTARLDADGYNLNHDAWVEYDGVLFNHVRLQAAHELGAVTLTVPLDAQWARFAHATNSGFGAGGRQNLWLDHDHELPFFPSVWIGHEEGGLAWFAESAASWQTRDSRPVKIVRDGDTTRLEITLADSVAAGAELSVEFGFLATPVKPLPRDYPMNLFADSHGVHLNRSAPMHPTIAAGVASWEGAGFFDLPLDEENPETWQWLLQNHSLCAENRAIFTPYTAAMMIPEEYPEVASRIAEWQSVPARHLSYRRDGKSYDWYWTCPAAGAGDFFAWKFDQLLDRIPLKGIYLDFGPAFRCSNTLHGCNGRFPLLAQRRLYQQLAASFVRRGVEDYAIVVHNSECVQWPTFTHVTHFLNGEGLRQMSSSTFHDGRDLQDTYTRLDFAAEHSSLPYGITSSVYVPVDPLLPRFGGGIEDQELYRFRMTKAVLAATLLHNTIPSPHRTHFGWYDKLVRIYEEFGVPDAEFLPYWRNQEMVTVLSGEDIYVSLFRSATRPEVLAIVSHMGPAHLEQQISVKFNPEALGFRELTSAEETLTAADPDYERLYEETNRIRIPVELGDFGIQDVQLDGNTLTMRLDFHSVALIRLTGQR